MTLTHKQNKPGNLHKKVIVEEGGTVGAKSAGRVRLIALAILAAVLWEPASQAGDRRKVGYGSNSIQQAEGKTVFSVIPTSQGYMKCETLGIKVWVENPGPKYYCLGIRIEWGDGSTMEHESSCEPFEALEEEEKRLSSHPYFFHKYRSLGYWEVRISLYELGSRKNLKNLGPIRLNQHLDPGVQVPAETSASIN